MAIHTVHSPVTNGEILGECLTLLLRSNGENEFNTTSLREILVDVRTWLREYRALGIVPEEFSLQQPLTAENLKRSIFHLIETLRDAGLVKSWTGEVQSFTKDPERICTNGWNGFTKLQLFSLVAKAQTERPEFRIPTQFSSEPMDLASARPYVQKALVAEGEELERIYLWAEDLLQQWKPAFMPSDPVDLPLLACAQFVKGILFTRQGDVEKAVNLILRAQMAFVQNRALWWTNTLCNFTIGHKDVAREIERKSRQHDVAVGVYYGELQRQEELGKTIRRINRITRNKLASFIRFDWLNAPFHPWDEPRENC